VKNQKARHARRLRLAALLGLRPAVLASSRSTIVSPLSVPPDNGWSTGCGWSFLVLHSRHSCSRYT